MAQSVLYDILDMGERRPNSLWPSAYAVFTAGLVNIQNSLIVVVVL